MLHEQGLDEVVIRKLHLDAPAANLSEWNKVIDKLASPRTAVTIAMVGKYVDHPDAYKSLTEALTHAGIHTGIQVDIRFIEAEEIEGQGTANLENVDAILVPGGFGERGIEGMIATAQFAREQRIPYLGICLGMQVAVIEFARHVAGLEKADSTEFAADTPYPVIALITEWIDATGQIEQREEGGDLGGTMRLGAQQCALVPGTLAHRLYDAAAITERHRHRYEFNNRYLEQLQAAGLRVSGKSLDGSLVEMIELADHPWFLACQFHPEFTSRPRDGHPLFTGFVQAAHSHKKGRSAS